MPYHVKDGTPCQTDSIDEGICKNRRCQAWADPAEQNSCPGSVDKDNNSDSFQECSGNGVCNSEGNCHCDCGYAPPYCLYRGEGGSFDSATVCPSNFKTVIIVLCVLLFVVIPIVFVLIMRWYLKKNKFEVSFRGFLDLMGVIDDPKPTSHNSPNVKFDRAETESPGNTVRQTNPGNSSNVLNSRTDPGRKYEASDEAWGPVEAPHPSSGYAAATTNMTNSSNQNIQSDYTNPNWGESSNYQGETQQSPPLPRRDYGNGTQSSAPSLPNRDYPR